ncbi:MAG: Asp-tRNA(Asn)/Glu-tRNA(Gln) amidotransferase subunit GatC [Anaerolineae bacterium]|nr:Asp-tRNA(Asn)/Glu-tRNA(Gln) amidotransferase subunit GatC [Anaerolineae bacterium]RIK23617.1 MAG: Asp-tRNA(Asn)/Glu-tRNA(Gln) amidotransferase GatCAB subunit C [Anaerolineae bacterium]
MSLSRDEVLKIAGLARLALSEEEVARFSDQLSAVLDYVARLDELDLRGIEPSVHAVARTNVMRDDVVMPSLSPTDALFNAAATSENQFLIQSILEE